jgi:hypothetical protein
MIGANLAEAANSMLAIVVSVLVELPLFVQYNHLGKLHRFGPHLPLSTRVADWTHAVTVTRSTLRRQHDIQPESIKLAGALVGYLNLLESS